MGRMRRFGVRAGRAIGLVPTQESNRIIAGGANYIGELAKSLFRPSQAEDDELEETFEQAVERLALSETDLLNRQKQLYRYAISYFVGGVLLVLYAVFNLFWYGYFALPMIGILTSMVFFAQSFAMHFRYFQVKNRRLDCSFKEWLDSCV